MEANMYQNTCYIGNRVYKKLNEEVRSRDSRKKLFDWNFVQGRVQSGVNMSDVMQHPGGFIQLSPGKVLNERNLPIFIRLKRPQKTTVDINAKSQINVLDALIYGSKGRPDENWEKTQNLISRNLAKPGTKRGCPNIRFLQNRLRYLSIISASKRLRKVVPKQGEKSLQIIASGQLQQQSVSGIASHEHCELSD